MNKQIISAKTIIVELEKVADVKKAEFTAKFFKTGKGEYAEEDKFLGVTVPSQRKIAKKYRDLSLNEVAKLLQNSYHEVRLTGLFILTYKFEIQELQKEIYDFYLQNISAVNNWDLVDATAHKIIGAYLYNSGSDRKILYKLAKSKLLWERRIAIISCFYFIKIGDLTDALKISHILIDDKEDLMHKAVGWMLREVGKQSKGELEKFLKKWADKMPRTMLRYAIERFFKEERLDWLK